MTINEVASVVKLWIRSDDFSMKILTRTHLRRISEARQRGVRGIDDLEAK